MKAVKNLLSDITKLEDGLLRETITNDVRYDISLPDWVIEYIRDIGEETDYSVVVYYNIADNMFFDADDVIDYCETMIREVVLEDYEYEQAKKVIKELKPWKGWRIEE